MYCTNCGKKIVDGYKFCSACGNPVDTVVDENSIENPQSLSVDSNPKKMTFKTKSLIVTALVAVITIAFIIFMSIYFSPKNILTRNVWWSEVKLHQRYESYSDTKKGFYTSIYCGSLTFETWGETKSKSYWYMGETYLPYEITDGFDFSDLDFEKTSENKMNWELLENNVLFYDKKYYKWDSRVSDETWYVKESVLRIGEDYYTKNSPIY